MNLRLPLCLGLVASAAVLAQGAVADEIRYLDPATCAPATKTATEIVEENWLQVSFRDKAGKIDRVDTRLVLDIKRGAEDAQAAAFRAALTELQNGAYAEARQRFGTMGGGGRTQDAGTGKIEYRPFPVEPGKAKWHTAYAIYHYALASYLEGVQSKDNEKLADALRVLDANKGDEKGFLERYKEGKSRWYADAWALKGKVLLALGQHDEAAATFDALYQKTITTPVGVRFSYEAKMGPGRIAEAKGDMNAAEAAYEAGASAIQSLFDQPLDPCSKRELGRWYHEARMQKARILLSVAEKSGSAADFGRLRTYLQQGTPDALKAKFSGKPSDVVDAVMAGGLSPSVQAVAQNGIGLAFLAEKKYADAIAAFTAVRVKYFSVADEVPRALHYLVKAADAAAAAATKPAVKAHYQAQADSARQELKSSYPASPWAKG